MKKLYFAALALAMAAAVAGNVKFTSSLLPGNVNVSYRLEELISKPGEADKFKTIDPAKAEIIWKEQVSKRGNAIDIKINIFLHLYIFLHSILLPSRIHLLLTLLRYNSHVINIHILSSMSLKNVCP